jgi:hypothetical protein
MHLHIAASPAAAASFAGAAAAAASGGGAGGMDAAGSQAMAQQPLLTPRGGAQAKDWTAALQDAQKK